MDPVQQVVWLVETQMGSNPSVQRLSRETGLSRFIITRLFAEATGLTVAAYLRGRRLTQAAKLLADSEMTVLRIADAIGYGSHEAFTRAFKTVFHFTPGEFRRNHRIQWVNTRPSLAGENLKHLSRITMEPQIVHVSALTLLGLETRFICAMSPDANNLKLIPPLFKCFGSRWAELPPRLDRFTYGACDCIPPEQRTHEDEMVYLVSASVAPDAQPPAGMTVWHIPARTYAHFTHRGPIGRLNETIKYIFGAWLPRSDYQHVEGPELERYDDRFGDGGEKCELDLLVPVQPKHR